MSIQLNVPQILPACVAHNSQVTREEKRRVMISLSVSLLLPSSSRAFLVPSFSYNSKTRVRVRVWVSPSLQLARSMSTSTEGTAEAASEVIVQYVVLRRDLIDTWPLGSVVTQGCHAAVAAIWAHRDRPDTAAYLSDSNLDSMHKVTLEVKGEVQMRNLSEKLEAGGIEHKTWIEQPENIPTCIATRPYKKSQVASFFKKLKLCK